MACRSEPGPLSLAFVTVSESATPIDDENSDVLPLESVAVSTKLSPTATPQAAALPRLTTLLPLLKSAAVNVSKPANDCPSPPASALKNSTRSGYADPLGGELTK